MSETSVKRKWAINGRFLAARNVTGVQRYAREILLAMDRLIASGAAPNLEVTVLAPANAAAAPPLEVIQYREARPLDGHLWEQATLAVAAKGGGLVSLCNTGPILHRRQIVCIHDLNTSSSPDSYSLAFRSAYNVMRPALARSAALITTVSHYSAEQIAKAGLAPRDKIRVATNGHEHALRWNRQGGTKARDPDTIVLLGSAAPHKNLGVVLKLASLLDHHGLRIAIVGGLDRKVFALGEQLENAPNVEWRGSLSDEELAKLLKSALCLAFPSRAEGFGLPPLEAMTLECPVVSSNTTSLPEVCGDAVLYASPDNADQWLQAFLRLKADPQLREKLVSLGDKRRLLFSWTRSAEVYLEAMACI